MPAALADPEFACVLGLLYYGHRARMALRSEQPSVKSKLRALFAL